MKIKNLLKISKKRITIVSALIIIILVPAVIYTLRNVNPAEAAWFNTSWSYREAFPISNTGLAQTDYQILITLNTSSLITAGKMKTDCSDLRATDVNGQLLNYFIEQGCNTTTTNIWVKVPSIPTSGATVYLYYGNPSAQNAENMDNVFSSNIAQSWEFNTNGNQEGWTSTNNLTGVAVNNGLFSMTSTGTDPFVYSPTGLTINSGTSKWVFVKIKVSSGSVDGTYWTTNLDNTWNQTKHQGTSPTLTFNGNWQLIAINEAANPAWANTITRLRLDPVSTNGVSIQIDWIRVQNSGSNPPTVGSPSAEEAGLAPIADWKLNEGYGATAHDSSSNQLNGTITGAVWKSGSDCMGSGKCLYFSGYNTGNKVDLGTSAKLNPSNFTISTWVRYQGASSYQYGYIFSNSRDCCGTYNGVNLLIGGGHLSGMIWNSTSATVTDPSQFPTNQWVFVSFSYDGSVMKLYRNGILVASANSTLGVGSPASFNNSIGTMGNGQGIYDFQGYIGEVKLYSYARSTPQIQVDYNSLSSLTSGANVLGASTANQNLSNGLVGYWKMDEATWSGTLNEVIDSSGNGNNGTAQGGTNDMPYPTLGKFGNGGYFDGTDDYIDAGNTSILNPSQVTVAAWVQKTSGSGYRRIIEKQYTNSYYLGLDATGTHFQGIFANSVSPFGTLVSTTTISNGVWYYVVITHDGSIDRLYVNGNLESTQADTTTLNNTTNNVTIGKQASGNGSYWNGKIDEARIYNRALSPTEVQQLYNYAPGPVAYWNFDEGQGGAINDVSGNGNTGSWSGTGSHWTQGEYGKGGSFNGSSDYITVPDSASWNLAGKTSTIQFWYKTSGNSQSSGHILDHFTGGTPGQGWVVWTDNTTLTFDQRAVTNGCVLTTPSRNDSKWHFISWTFDGSHCNLYVDGIFTTSDSYSSDLVNRTAPLYIGGGSAGSPYYYGGSLDDIKIYNYARTQGQIVQDMNGGHPLGGSPIGSQVGYWKFDEGYGLTNYNSGSGSHTYDGTITSATFSNDGKFGKAMSFDGTTGKYVSIPAISSLTTGNPFTISVWVRPGSTGTYRTIVGYDGTHRLLISATGQMLSQQSGNFFSNAAGDVPDNKWTYVAYTFDGTQEKWYINGNQSGAAHALTTAAWSSAFKVGQYDNVNYPYKGLIDELKIYSSALTASEIQLDYNHGSSEVLGSASDTSGLTGGQAASNSASAYYCIPGDTSPCSPPKFIWNLEEGQGATANDSSGNAINGTLANSPSWTEGKIGSGISLNGSNNYVITSTSVSSSPTTETMSLWVYPRAPGVIVSELGQAAINTGYHYTKIGLNSTNELRGNIWNCNATLSFGTINLNQWYYVTLVYDGSSERAYLNGQFKNSNVCSRSAPSTQYLAFGATDTQTAGGFDTTSYFNGKIDQVTYFSYARTPGQIAWDYNNGGPIGYWKFDECQGTTAYDSSGNGNNLAITISAGGTQTTAGTCQSPTDGTGMWYNARNGKYNSAYNSDGTNHDSASGNVNNLPASTLTVSAWVNVTADVNWNNFVNHNWVGNGWLLFDDASHKPLFGLGQGGTQYNLYASQNMSTGTWHLLVGTYDGTTQKIYVDGVLSNSATHSNFTFDTSASNVNIGQGATNAYIDDVRIYNYALTQAQIQQLYNQGAGVRFAEHRHTIDNYGSFIDG